MSWLHELVHEVNWFRLFISYSLTSASEQVVDLLPAVLFISVVLDPSLQTASLLFDKNEKSEEFNGPTCDPFESSIERAFMWMVSINLQSF